MTDSVKTEEILLRKLEGVLKSHHPLPGLKKFLGEINYRFNLASFLWLNQGSGACSGLLVQGHRDSGADGDSFVGREFPDGGIFGACADRRPEVLVISDLSRLRAAGLDDEFGGAMTPYRCGLVLRQGLGRGSVGIVCLLKPEQLRQVSVLSQTLDAIKPAFGNVFSTFGVPEALLGQELAWSDTRLIGRSIVPGRAYGRVVYLNRFTDLDQHQIERCDDTSTEQERLDAALSRLKSIFARAVRHADAPLDDIGFIYELFLHVLSDPSFRGELRRIIDEGYTAKSAAVLLARRYQASFNQIGDEYLRERRHDFIYLTHRLIGTLEDGGWHRKQAYDDARIILAGDEIGIPDIMMIPADRLVAIIAHRGSALAHVSILARAKSIPVIADIIPLHLLHLNNRMVAVNADEGYLLVEPGADTQRAMIGLSADSQRARTSAGPAGVVCSTDGVPVSCYVNLGLFEESKSIDRTQIAGVGLFRSEIYFHSQLGFPSLQDQTGCYRRLLLAFHPAPVWMRLLDIGRDKSLPYFSAGHTKRDWCGARILTDNPDIMRTQMESMLRANHNLGNLRILVPNVTQIEEIIAIGQALDEAYQRLSRRLPGLMRPEFGAMVEVPGLIFLIDHLARYVDYISIGSNDLLRNLFLADREDQTTMDYHSFLSPALLRALAVIMNSAQRAHLRVGICGEAITGTHELMMCLGAGLRHLSIGAASVSRARLRIMGLDIARCEDLFRRAGGLETTGAVKELLADEFAGDLVRLA